MVELFLVLMGMPCGVYKDIVIIPEYVYGFPGLLLRIDDPEWHLKDIGVGAQLVYRGDTVGIRRQERHPFFSSTT